MKTPEENLSESNSLVLGALLHDIGKMIDWRAIGLQQCDSARQPVEGEPHDFEKCTESRWGIGYSAAPWEGIFRKNEELRRGHWPGSTGWALVRVADQLAAGFGRALPEQELRGGPRFGRYCLWTGKQEQDPRLRTEQDLRHVIEFLNESPSWDRVEERYGDVLLRRPETARPGLNVTSLHSHCAISGKVSRVLGRVSFEGVRPHSAWSEVERASQRSKLTVAHFRILFPQRPFRTRDLNVFEERRKALDQAIESHADCVLCRFGSECICVFPTDQESLSFAHEFLDSGFQAERRQYTTPIAELIAHGLQARLPRSWERLHGSLPDQIALPLCEGCQMARGTRRWPAELLVERSDISEKTREAVGMKPWSALGLEDFPSEDRDKVAPWLEEWAQEELCGRCYELRRRASTLSRLSRWSSGRAAWVRINLNIDALLASLKGLHQAYIRSTVSGVREDLVAKVDVRYPLVADFLDDYALFVKSFAERLSLTVGEANFEEVDEDLWCVRIEKGQTVVQVLYGYNELLSRAFPRMIAGLDSVECPVRLAISVSTIRHPFFSHWQFLEAPGAEVSAQVVGSGLALVSSRHLGDVLSALGGGRRAALHRLREIARTSKALAELVLGDKFDRYSRDFARLRQLLPLGLDFESLLTLTKLGEG